MEYSCISRLLSVNHISCRSMKGVFFFLGCHIAIFSSILRLIMRIFLDFLLISRINCSYFGQTFQKFGKTSNNLLVSELK
jgi:hypothetical protein